MRRVLAVLISVLTAVWPLLLPQPVSANPCGVTTAEYVSVKASGSKVDQSGGFYLDQSGDAGYGGSGGTGAATSGAGGAGGGGGQGGNPYVKNSPYGGDALTVNIPVNVAVQDSDQKAKAYGDSNGGNGGYTAAGSLNAAIPVAAQLGAGNAKANGGDGGDGSGSAGLINLLPIGNGDGGAGGANTDGFAKNSADSDIYSKTSAGSADGGNGGGHWQSNDSDQDASLSNKGNSPTSTAGAASVTSTATGGQGGNGGNGGNSGAATGTGGAGAAGGSTDARTADNSRNASTAAVNNDVEFGAAQGDPCKQIIKDSVGVMAINGYNKIKGSVMQNVNANLGNAANTSVNLGELGLQNRAWGYEPNGPSKSQTPGVNINVNPNTNQNTNIISF